MIDHYDVYDSTIHALGERAIENDEQALFLSTLLTRAARMLAMQEEPFIMTVLASFAEAVAGQAAEFATERAIDKARLH